MEFQLNTDCILDLMRKVTKSGFYKCSIPQSVMSMLMSSALQSCASIRNNDAQTLPRCHVSQCCAGTNHKWKKSALFIIQDT